MRAILHCGTHYGECTATGHLFASQLQRTADLCCPQVSRKSGKSRSRATSRRRRRWATSLVERARPHDSGSGPLDAPVAVSAIATFASFLLVTGDCTTPVGQNYIASNGDVRPGRGCCWQENPGALIYSCFRPSPSPPPGLPPHSPPSPWVLWRVQLREAAPLAGGDHRRPGPAVDSHGSNNAADQVCSDRR